jgi:hypothetical protein
MITFNELKDKEVITVFVQNSTNVFHIRKAIVDRYANGMDITLLNKNGKRTNGNWFSSWWPINLKELNKTKIATLYLNEEEVRKNPKAVIKEIIQIVKIV